MQGSPPNAPTPPIGLLTPDRLYRWDGVGWVPTWDPRPSQRQRQRATKRDWLGRVAWILVVFIAAQVGVALLTGNAHPEVPLLASLAAAVVPLGIMGGWLRSRGSWVELAILAAVAAWLYVVGIFVGLSSDPVACPGAPATDCDIGFGLGGMIGAALAYLPLLASLALGKVVRARLFSRR
ncbi:MAG: hypothetical protein ACREQ5_14705 [Candidatus Dormibacteria bacterium]